MILYKNNHTRQFIRGTTSDYLSERELQDFLVDNADYVFEQPTVCISEAIIESTSRIDILGIGASGDIFIVECKLASNEEIRRKVIGQITEYAALLNNWDIQRLLGLFQSQHGDNFLGKMLGDNHQNPANREAFINLLDSNLTSGS